MPETTVENPVVKIQWKTIAKVASIVLAAIVPSLVTYSGASDDATHAGDKAEAGNQEGLKALLILQDSIKALDARVTTLDKNLTELRKRVQSQAARRKAVRPTPVAVQPMPPPPPVVATPIELSPNLDVALEKARAGTKK